MVAQVAVLDHPGAFSALILVGTRAVAPGRPDADLPDHDPAAMRRLFAFPMPDWTDPEAVADFASARADILGDDREAARASACPRSRFPRSSSTAAATFSSPSANARRSPARSPGARLLVLEEAATAIPDAAAGEVAEAMLALG
jgi:hypothetical protein